MSRIWNRLTEAAGVLCHAAGTFLIYDLQNFGDAMSTPYPDSARVEVSIARSLHAHWKFFLVEGTVLLLLGFGAILLPPLASLAIALIIGWVLLISGIAGLVSTVAMRAAPGFMLSLVSAVVAIIAGVVLLRWPSGGVVTLTVILSVFLAIEGLVSILYAIEHQRGASGRWGMLAFSGFVDLVLAGLIFAGLPGTAAWAIGLLVGINLLLGGCALISMALHARSTAPRSSVVSGVASI
jgi:uncharacterized membrane protein HdeD (DUF308 family)